MPHLPSKRNDYPAAAKKHLNDAKVLLDNGRFDGTVYLSGFVVECALRTVVMLGHAQHEAVAEAKEKGRKPDTLTRAFRRGARAADLIPVGARKAREFGGDHNLAELEKATTSYKDVLSDETACYVPAPIVKNVPFRELTKFVDIRYQAEGVMNAADAKKWFDEAKAVYENSVGAMIRDGLIK